MPMKTATAARTFPYIPAAAGEACFVCDDPDRPVVGVDQWGQPVCARHNCTYCGDGHAADEPCTEPDERPDRVDHADR